MNKKFDSVAFQRERREALSKKLSKMSPKEIVEYFHSETLPTTPRKRTRAAAHNNQKHVVHIVTQRFLRNLKMHTEKLSQVISVEFA